MKPDYQKHELRHRTSHDWGRDLDKTTNLFLASEAQHNKLSLLSHSYLAGFNLSSHIDEKPAFL